MASSETQAAIAQPSPQPGQADVLPLVLADLQARAAVGLAKYGTLLQTHNGRDALWDALQEAYDLAMYLRQRIEEQPKYALGAKVRYRPYHTNDDCSAEGWHREPWRVVGIYTTHLLGKRAPIITYALQRWEGIDAYSWNLFRPHVPIDEAQLAPWAEEARDEPA